MDQNLPIQPPPADPPKGPAHPASTVRISRREAFVNTASKVTLRSFPRIPDPVKRLLLGRRSITIDGNTLDTTMQLFLAAQRAAGLDGLVSSPDVAIARNQVEITASGFRQDILVQSVSNLSIPGPAGPIRVRHYRTAQSHAPLLVFFHGGGFVIGSLDTHDDLCRLICRDGGMHVLSVDYRRAPEHKAPAASEDAFAAYRWALEHAVELGANPDRVAVGGDSAGGNLAAVVSLLARDGGVASPALQLLIYPMANPRGETRSWTLFAEGFFLTRRHHEWFMDHYLNGADVDDTDHRVAPLLADDLSGLPPALVLTGGFDPLRDEGKAYAAALLKAGVRVDHRHFGSLIHAFVNLFPLGGDSAIATEEMISALRGHLARG
ncbi:alpha/beta hydrolase [Mycobacterium sp. URHB0021]